MWYPCVFQGGHVWCHCEPTPMYPLSIRKYHHGRLFEAISMLETLSGHQGRPCDPLAHSASLTISQIILDGVLQLWDNQRLMALPG